MTTTLYRLPLSRLEEFDRAGVISDSDLAAMRPGHCPLDQLLAYQIYQQPDVFAYALKAEGQIAQEHAEVEVGYITPPKLRERLKALEQLDAASIYEDLEEKDVPVEYLEKNLASLRAYLQTAVDQDQALLIVRFW
jgi:hypothetical protein